MIWRTMNRTDLETVFTLGNQIHQDYQEDRAVFESRWRIYPEGCHVLDDQEGVVTGYAISHPWTLHNPPKLNTVLETLPARPDTYYIHDIALAPAARQGGYGRQIIAHLHTHASQNGFATSSLVAVGGTRAFWEKQGYSAHRTPELAALLTSYDGDAAYMIRSGT